jgi:hypothetical protein
MKSEVSGLDVSLVMDVYKSMFIDSLKVLQCDPHLNLGLSSSGTPRPLPSWLSWFGKSWRRSWTTFCDRLANEGFSFVTKTLPKLGKAIERGLETGVFQTAPEFGAAGRIPKFLEEVLTQVFDGSGVLLPTVNKQAVRWLRQFAYFFYKYELDYTSAQLEKAAQKYFANEASIKPVKEDEVLMFARALIKSLFTDFNCCDLTPRHASGALAGREDLDERWDNWTLYEELNALFPYHKWFQVNERQDDLEQRVRVIERRSYGVSRQTYVPKDSRGPRDIAMEPKEYIYVQGALMDAIVTHIERHPLTRGQVNFTDQTINRKIAVTASMDASMATLDLKDASDLVSLEMVKYLFGDTELLKYLLAARTPFIEYGGKLHQLRKFAAMGSRLCFPVMATCLWAISVSAAVKLRGERVRDALKDTFVYGDDIAVRSDSADSVIYALECHGLRVNVDKSFQWGRFRESCGSDVYDGVDVTPVRFKTPFRPFRSRPEVLDGYVSAANALRSYPSVQKTLWEWVERHFGKLPLGTSRATYPCKVVECETPPVLQNMVLGHKVRENPDLQYAQVKTWVSKSQDEDVKLDDWPRLHKALVAGPDRKRDLRPKQYGNVLVKRWMDVQ